MQEIKLFFANERPRSDVGKEICRIVATICAKRPRLNEYVNRLVTGYSRNV